MNDNIKKSSNSYRHINWNFTQGEAEDRDTLDSVLKFHYKTMNRVNGKIVNAEKNLDIQTWASTFASRDIIPDSYEEIVHLEVNIHKQKNSYIDFDSENTVDLKNLGQILFDAFGREAPYSSKRYPSAGALYPIIPLLIVLKSHNSNSRLGPGCYVFDSTQARLLKISNWDSTDLDKVRRLLNNQDENLIAPHCIAYALDIRRAITKYNEKGYRHALIEVGLMAQSFRESLQLVNNLGERCWSGFNDLPLTHICGLNIRLCPIALVQWFGFNNDI